MRRKKDARLNVVRVLFAIAVSATVFRWVFDEKPTAASIRAPPSTSEQPAAEVQRSGKVTETVAPASTIPENSVLESEFYRRREARVSPFQHRALLTPSRLCLNDTSMIILIHSHPAYRRRRDAVRETWGSAVKSGWWPRGLRQSVPVRDLCLAFVVGLSESHNTAVLQEHVVKDDIIQGDFIDHYHNLTLKSLLGLKLVTGRCLYVKYLLKGDDDTFINLPLLLSYLNSHNDLQRSIIGPHLSHRQVKRNGKFALTRREFPFDILPPYEGGSAYVITADVLSELFNTSEFVPHLFIEDVYVTGILGRIVGVSHVTGRPTSGRQQLATFAYRQSRQPRACDFARDHVYTGTGFHPRQMLKLWRKLVEGRPCTARTLKLPNN